MRYRMIGIDLDGTLLNRRGRVSDANVAAIRRAREAGVLVVPCTGRGWRESLTAIEQIRCRPDRELEGGSAKPQAAGNAGGLVDTGDPGVFVTGASVVDVLSGRALDLAVIEPHVAEQIVAALHDQPEAVLVFHDEDRVGYDYLVTGRGSLSANTQAWFQRTGATVHYQEQVSADDLHHALRVCVVASEPRVSQMKRALRGPMDGLIQFHSFEAVQVEGTELSLHILEVFAAGVDKWRGLSWVASQRGVDPGGIAVIGDEINDVTMIESAACGVAMGNAIDAVKDVADYVTKGCDEDGVALALERMLAGQW